MLTVFILLSSLCSDLHGCDVCVARSHALHDLTHEELAEALTNIMFNCTLQLVVGVAAVLTPISRPSDN
ncbi:hypothetical protein PF005_g24442 [Phytophthora fragariae]|uniref:Uncharacterized protein n=1 Tax=Phytophthora fragariae TaxID=53985 RepID=A0A6A3QJC6_9STRA|nr:hypothetical protein PF003_g16996 [Phytophthora fragariae]KAE8925472.1 hypothetical protein PF009_g24322 [Phytophthora fragariae]KAE8978618.1 hypothetical protein PF011_g23170 [Phytophthora fragariae]KAE9072303.1 hypothetical protein PF010_g25537 [Phytophthora fragariae]KAE9077445.1 hypothetical protein PF007_g24241 [Phytophthora fragariae]